MRDRLVELTPLLLVGVALLAFQLTRGSSPTFQFQALSEATPTPLAAAAASGAVARPAPRGPASPPAACNAAHPQFSGGIATLKAALGSSMGEPVECEHATSPQGDTQQKTTGGLAYYRKNLNLACFTTGWDHWALVNGGLVHWTGDAVDPPVDASLAAR
jgi:hypothetical protein